MMKKESYKSNFRATTTPQVGTDSLYYVVPSLDRTCIVDKMYRYLNVERNKPLSLITSMCIVPLAKTCVITASL